MDDLSRVPIQSLPNTLFTPRFLSRACNSGSPATDAHISVQLNAAAKEVWRPARTCHLLCFRVPGLTPEQA